MRKTTLVAAGAALVLTLTACSGNTTSGTAAPAGAQSQSGGSSGLASPFTDAFQLASASKQGTEKSKSAKFTMEGSAAGQTMSATGAMAFDGANTKFSMTSTAAGQTTEMRMVDQVMYIKLPADQQAQMGTDKSWAKISADGTDPISQAMGSALSQSAEQSDPSKILEQVSKAGRIVSSDQTELNGVQVNHYKVELDVAKALDQFTGQVPAAARDQINEKLKGKDLKIPAELWLDKDNLPVQVTMDQGAMMQAMGAPAGDAKFTMKYSDWGTQVDVAAPPAEQVVDLGELMKKAGR
ncbi:LppX_LprAFG lipoprotein [Amycolatopsis solani]|uniref:LppX_LprAFG lipoprotein n=1 Tax=Amycolatopsis solani TaxID=3028615 RepID=UPI0025AF3F59|nr:LppX_LprAFG lipoprotein [Amycolatopsis sp. MEP2-6]